MRYGLSNPLVIWSIGASIALIFGAIALIVYTFRKRSPDFEALYHNLADQMAAQTELLDGMVRLIERRELGMAVPTDVSAGIEEQLAYIISTPARRRESSDYILLEAHFTDIVCRQLLGSGKVTEDQLNSFITSRVTPPKLAAQMQSALSSTKLLDTGVLRLDPDLIGAFSDT